MANIGVHPEAPLGYPSGAPSWPKDRWPVTHLTASGRTGGQVTAAMQAAGNAEDPGGPPEGTRGTLGAPPGVHLRGPEVPHGVFLGLPQDNLGLTLGVPHGLPVGYPRDTPGGPFEYNAGATLGYRQGKPRGTPGVLWGALGGSRGPPRGPGRTMGDPGGNRGYP